MKISLVHPSRERPGMAEEALLEWRSNATGPHSIEHVLSVDADDPDLEAYRLLAARHGSVLVVRPNRTMVAAMNRGAEAATGDLIVAMSDDFGCPPGWDLAVVATLPESRAQAAVLVDDGLRTGILTLPILTRALYDRLGYVYHPSYVSMFADEDLTELARREGVLVDTRHLLFPHRHPSAGLRPADATHHRQNNWISYFHGWRSLQLRRIDDFGPPRVGAAAALARLRVRAYYAIRSTGRAARGRVRRVLPRWAARLEHGLHGATLSALNRLGGVENAP